MLIHTSMPKIRFRVHAYVRKRGWEEGGGVVWYLSNCDTRNPSNSAFSHHHFVTILQVPACGFSSFSTLERSQEDSRDRDVTDRHVKRATKKAAPKTAPKTATEAGSTSTPETFSCRHFYDSQSQQGLSTCHSPRRSHSRYTHGISQTCSHSKLTIELLRPNGQCIPLCLYVFVTIVL